MKAEVVIFVNEYTKLNWNPEVLNATCTGKEVRLVKQAFFICMKSCMGIAISYSPGVHSDCCIKKLNPEF